MGNIPDEIDNSINLHFKLTARLLQDIRVIYNEHLEDDGFDSIFNDYIYLDEYDYSFNVIILNRIKKSLKNVLWSFGILVDDEFIYSSSIANYHAYLMNLINFKHIDVSTALVCLDIINMENDESDAIDTLYSILNAVSPMDVTFFYDITLSIKADLIEIHKDMLMDIISHNEVIAVDSDIPNINRVRFFELSNSISDLGFNIVPDEVIEIMKVKPNYDVLLNNRQSTISTFMKEIKLRYTDKDETLENFIYYKLLTILPLNYLEDSETYRYNTSMTLLDYSDNEVLMKNIHTIDEMYNRIGVYRHIDNTQSINNE